MRKSLRASTACTASVLLLAAAPGLAAPPVAVPLENEGEPGVWLPEDMARETLADVKELRVRRAELDLCYRRSEVQRERVRELHKGLDAARESAETSQQMLDAAVRGREEAERARHGWLAGMPWLWGGVGVVVGAVATGIIISQAR